MSRAARILIALIMTFTAAAAHARAAIVVTGAGEAVMELALDGVGDRAVNVVALRCAFSTGSPGNARSSCPFETGTRAELLSLSGRIGRQDFPNHMVPIFSGRTDNPDHGPPKLLS